MDLTTGGSDYTIRLENGTTRRVEASFLFFRVLKRKLQRANREGGRINRSKRIGQQGEDEKEHGWQSSQHRVPPPWDVPLSCAFQNRFHDAKSTSFCLLQRQGWTGTRQTRIERIAVQIPKSLVPSQNN